MDIETGILLVYQLMCSLCKEFPGLLLEALRHAAWSSFCELNLGLY
jgi:hypothetical protein